MDSSIYKKSKRGLMALVVSLIVELSSLVACGDLSTPSAGSLISTPPVPITTTPSVPVQSSPTNSPTLTQKPSVVPPTTATPSQIIGKKWKLESYMNGTTLENSRLNITTTFSDTGRVDGKDDCNYYFGNYTLADSGKIHIGEVSETAMACTNPSNQDGPRYYLVSRLNSAALYEIAGNSLTLKDNKSNILLVFQQI